MGNGDAVRDGYATYLIMVDASFPRHTLDALCNDVAQVTRVGRSEEGRRVFGEQFKAVEGACGRRGIFSPINHAPSCLERPRREERTLAPSPNETLCTLTHKPLTPTLL